MSGKSWLMGDVSAMIKVSPGFSSSSSWSQLTEQDVKPAKEIIDEMVNDAKKCLENGSKIASGGGAPRAKL